MTGKRIRFSNPPVVEVVCSLQFSTGEHPIQTAHVGLYWQQIRREFPHATDNAPLTAIVEPPIGAAPMLNFQFEAMPPLRRVWFTSDDGQHLIQIQEDRFVYNWKQRDEGGTYPTYDVISAAFFRHFDNFSSFMASEKVGPFSMIQYELTYVNNIDSEGADAEAIYGDVLVDHFCKGDHDRFLPRAEAINWATSYPLPDAFGRLHIAARTAVRAVDQKRVLRVDLTARGIPPERPNERVNNWFAVAHDWITHGFADATSPDYHEKWGRVS